MNVETTKRQRAILRIVERGCSTGEPRTYREIGREIGIRNVSAVAKHVQALRRKGLLSASSGRSRSLRVSSAMNKFQSPVVHIPLFGSIPAGHAQMRDQEVEACVSV